jgi:hypothetical protein
MIAVVINLLDIGPGGIVQRVIPFVGPRLRPVELPRLGHDIIELRIDPCDQRLGLLDKRLLHGLDLIAAVFNDFIACSIRLPNEAQEPALFHKHDCIKVEARGSNDGIIGCLRWLDDIVKGRMCGIGDGGPRLLCRSSHLSKLFLYGVALAVQRIEFTIMTMAHQRRRENEVIPVLIDCVLDPVVEIIITVAFDMLDQNPPQLAGVQRLQGIQLGAACAILRLEAGSP